MSNLKSYLTETTKGWAMLGHPAVSERFVLRNGQVFEGRKRPKGYRRGTPKECFSNSARLVQKDLFGLRYVEGYVISKDLPIPILHAWAIDAEDRVIDVTIKEPEKHEYMGVVVSGTELWRELCRLKHFGLIDTGMGLNVRWMFERDPELKAEVEAIINKRRAS